MTPAELARCRELYEASGNQTGWELWESYAYRVFPALLAAAERCGELSKEIDDRLEEIAELKALNRESDAVAWRACAERMAEAGEKLVTAMDGDSDPFGGRQETASAYESIRSEICAYRRLAGKERT